MSLLIYFIDVHSDYFYRLWYRSMVNVGDFIQLTEGSDICRIEVESLQQQTEFRKQIQNNTRPMMLCNAMNDWKCWKETDDRWSVEQWRERFSKIQFKVQTDECWFIIIIIIIIYSRRLLIGIYFYFIADVYISFEDYCEYMKQQCDEVPLYVFDRKFDRKQSTDVLLNEYKVSRMRGMECICF
jgi:hypothetical protein